MAKSSAAERRNAAPPPKAGLPLWVTLLVVAFLLAIAGTLLVVSRGGGPDDAVLRLADDARVARLTATGGNLDERFDEGEAHVPAPSYAVDPPAGGDHSPTAAAAGVYTSEAVPPDGTIVHAMEHGYVIIWFRPDLRAEDLAAIRKAYDAYPRDVLVVPRPSLARTATPVVATAWHHRLLLPSAAAEPLIDFAAIFRNQGPEKVPH